MCIFVSLQFLCILVKAAVCNFRVTIINFLCSFCKKCHYSHRQLFDSEVVWEYHEISVFSHAFVFRIDKNPVAPILLATSVTLSVLSVVTGPSTPHFWCGTSWLTVCVLRSDSPLSTKECLQAALSAWAETDQFTPLQISLKPFRFKSNWT